MRDGGGRDAHVLIAVLSFEFEVLSYSENSELSIRNF